MEHKKKLKAKKIYEGKKNKINAKTAIITILIIAIITVGILSLWTFLIPKLTGIDSQNENQTIVVTVNGEEITQLQLDDQWNNLPITAKMQMTKDQLLEQLVQETLLLQEAKKENITVSDEEVDQFINLQLAQMGMEYEQFEKALESQNIKPEEMKKIYNKQLTVAKLFDQTLDGALNATDEEVETYFEENKNNFIKNEQVDVKHILIPINETQNESVAKEQADEIVSELEAKNNSNFCDLVTKYSVDLGSVNKCGEYKFEKGQMVPEFEEAGFDMKNGELRVVKTNYGLHIMLKVNSTPETQMKLNDKINEKENSPTIVELIRQQLIEEKAQQIFKEYVDKLIENAEIKYFETIENVEITKPANETEISLENEIEVENVSFEDNTSKTEDVEHITGETNMTGESNETIVVEN